MTSAAGKTLPNVNELLGGRLYALVHGFRAYILSGSLAEPRRRWTQELAPRELLLQCYRSSTQVEELVLEVLPLPHSLHLASES